jgi:hypothetical protein
MLILLTLFAVAGMSAIAQNDADRLTIPFSDPSRPGMLNVNTLNGSVRITAGSGTAVTVEVPGGRGQANRQATESRGLRRIDGVGGVSVQESNNVISVRSGTRSNANLMIQVPVRTNLIVDALNGSRIVIEGVDGEIEVNNSNGNVALNDVSGSVVAHSTNGNVSAVIRRVTPEKLMAFTSVNGNVDVTLPADVKANVKMRTLQGGIYTDFDIQLQSIGSNALSTTSSRANQRGPYVEIDRNMFGTINGGGPDFELRTVNGNLYIRKGR